MLVEDGWCRITQVVVDGYDGLFAAAGGRGHLSDDEMCVVEDHVADERSLGRFQI